MEENYRQSLIMKTMGTKKGVFFCWMSSNIFLRSTAFSLVTTSRTTFVSKTLSNHPSRLTSYPRFLSMSTSSDNSNNKHADDLYLRTPLIKSQPLSELANRPVFLKLDLLQPSGSFKDRGMANLCHKLYYDSERPIRQLVSSSGGNAGLAVTTVARQLHGMNVHVVVPETTKPLVIEKLKSLGAEVTVHGENWNAADLLAREMVDSNPNAAYVSPYDDPLLWEGHSTAVGEIFEQLPKDQSMSAIIASVGGGGLICGVLDGLQKHASGNSNTLVIAAETEGASSFDKGWQAGEAVSLSSIDSVATSLGALQVTNEAIKKGKHLADSGKGELKTSVCTDKEAIEACIRFATDHKMLVEPACGAALAAIYSDRLRNALFSMDETSGAIVVEVCGGNAVNLDLLKMWQTQFLKE